MQIRAVRFLPWRRVLGVHQSPCMCLSLSAGVNSQWQRPPIATLYSPMHIDNDAVWFLLIKSFERATSQLRKRRSAMSRNRLAARIMWSDTCVGIEVYGVTMWGRVTPTRRPPCNARCSVAIPLPSAHVFHWTYTNKPFELHAGAPILDLWIPMVSSRIVVIWY